MTKAEFSLYTDYYEYPQEEIKKRSAEFYAEMKRRRTVRQFSSRPAHLILMKNLDNFTDFENNK